MKQKWVHGIFIIVIHNAPTHVSILVSSISLRNMVWTYKIDLMTGLHQNPQVVSSCLEAQLCFPSNHFLLSGSLISSCLDERSPRSQFLLAARVTSGARSVLSNFHSWLEPQTPQHLLWKLPSVPPGKCNNFLSSVGFTLHSFTPSIVVLALHRTFWHVFLFSDSGPTMFVLC